MPKFEKDLGWYFPDIEAHLQGWMRTMKQVLPNNRIGYQLHKYEAVKKFCSKKRKAVDIGSHIGLWAYPMSFDFEEVICFEPMPDHQECWNLNMSDVYNVSLIKCALGAEEKYNVAIRTRTVDSSGDTGIELEAKTGDILTDMKTLDSFNLQDIDFIKCDCEGFELYVMQGAKETIERCKPVICIEQKPNHETGVEDRYNIKFDEAINYLQSLGMTKLGSMQGDYFMVFRGL